MYLARQSGFTFLRNRGWIVFHSSKNSKAIDSRPFFFVSFEQLLTLVRTLCDKVNYIVRYDKRWKPKIHTDWSNYLNSDDITSNNLKLEKIRRRRKMRRTRKTCLFIWLFQLRNYVTSKISLATVWKYYLHRTFFTTGCFILKYSVLIINQHRNKKDSAKCIPDLFPTYFKLNNFTLVKCWGYPIEERVDQFVK